MPPPPLADTSSILSPGLVLFRELVEKNLDEMLRIAGSADRLRPHCKTHKMAQIVAMQRGRGITRHKCATLAEAEMLALAGIEDIFLAYNPVGPNVARVVRFVERYPQVRFSVAADHPRTVAALGAALESAGRQVEVLLDIDCGQHRTGVPAGPEALALYEQIAGTRGLVPGGLHVYDGHNHQTDVTERRAAVLAAVEPALSLRKELERRGLPVPRIVAGGSGSFPILAMLDEPGLELSPGTVIFHDWGYQQIFPDLPFVPAAWLLTRVISRPTPSRVTLDLGYKAVASDPPADRRVIFPDLPDARCVLQNEEHLVIETDRAPQFAPGDALWALPRHICPTCALHREVTVVSQGRVVDRWPVTARDRVLTV